MGFKFKIFQMVGLPEKKSEIFQTQKFITLPSTLPRKKVEHKICLECTLFIGKLPVNLIDVDGLP